MHLLYFKHSIIALFVLYKCPWCIQSLVVKLKIYYQSIISRSNAFLLSCQLTVMITLRSTSGIKKTFCAINLNITACYRLDYSSQILSLPTITIVGFFSKKIKTTTALVYATDIILPLCHTQWAYLELSSISLTSFFADSMIEINLADCSFTLDYIYLKREQK